jgi:hypothetical protein
VVVRFPRWSARKTQARRPAKGTGLGKKNAAGVPGCGSIPRWSAGKPQSVVTRRKPIGAVHKKKSEKKTPPNRHVVQYGIAGTWNLLRVKTFSRCGKTETDIAKKVTSS